MRITRILIIFFSALTILLFVGSRIYERRTSDYIKPVITADEDALEMPVSVTDEELLAGMTASDNRDGDVTDTLIVSSRSKFIRPSTVKVYYAAFDKNNNVGTYTRELKYTDYVSPRFSVNAPLCFIESEKRDVMQVLNRVTAFDCIDGDITSQIMITQGEERTVQEGVQASEMILQVSNRSGDTSMLTLDVLFEDYNIFNQQKPHLSEYLVYTNVGETPDFAEFADGVGYGNNMTSFADLDMSREANVKIDTSKVDFETPGIYEVTYTLVRDTEEGRQMPLGSTTMIVVVEGEHGE